jgi:hypothetical protein
MSHSNHFLSLDANKKPIVRKGVNYQSFIPPVLPGPKLPASRSAQLKKVHVAMDVKIGTAWEKISRTLPEMGPFNSIAQEIATDYFEAQEDAMKLESDPVSRSSNYWDDLEESLDKIVKQENLDESTSQLTSFSLDSLRSLLSRLEAWNERSIKATLGTGQVLSSEVDELLEEARVVSQRVELPMEVLAKLRILQKAGEAFSNKVRSKLTLKGKEKVPLRVLMDLMKEAEALPVETEEVRFFRNQRGRIQAICHSAQKASRDKSLDKSKDVTIEAAEVRAILPDLDFLREQVSKGEWVQKAMNKTDKKGVVPLQTIEQLFEDPSAGLIKPEECEIMRILKQAMEEAQAWQSRTNKLLSGIPIINAEGRSVKKMPTIEELQALQEEHAHLNRICVPAVSSHIEGIIRRAKGWVKKQERTLTGTWSLADAKNLLDEGHQVAQQVDLNPEIGNLEREVAAAEEWCSQAKKLIASLALTDIDQLDPLVSSSFKAQPIVELEIGAQNPGYIDRLSLRGKELQALKNYENSLSDLTVTLSNVKQHILPLLESERLPTQNELERIKTSLGMVRDLKLEDDINQLFDGATKWSDRAESVLAVSFPRPAGVLRSLGTLIYDLASSPMRYHHWRDIMQVASEEVWAHGLRYLSLPISESRLDHLIETCPFDSMEIDSNKIVNLEEARKIEQQVASVLKSKQDEWMKEVLGLQFREGTDGLVASEFSLLLEFKNISSVYTMTCEGLLTPGKSHSRQEAEKFLSELQTSDLLELPSLVTKVQLALNRNSALESSSVHLKERLERDYVAFKADEVSTETNLFHDLLQLLERVEFSELRVEHFSSFFVAIVNKLLAYQSSVRHLFKWDQEETVTVIGYRPSLKELQALWNKIVTEAENEHRLSEVFIKDVAYISSAYRVLSEAEGWRFQLSEISDSLRGDAGEKYSIATLVKHVSKWTNLAVQVPYADIISNEEMSMIDDWAKQITNGVINKAKQRKRASLDEAKTLLEKAPRPLCINTVDYSTLRSQVAAAEELRKLSSDLILQSFAERSKLDIPNVDPFGVPSVPANETDPVAMELTRLLRESRKSPIAVGTETFIDKELRARSVNRTLTKILSRSHVVPLETIEPFVESIFVDQPPVSNDNDENEPVSAKELDSVSFSANLVLVNAVKERAERTHKWKRLAAEFAALLPVQFQQMPTVPTQPTNRKTATAAATVVPDTQPVSVSNLESSIGSYLSAPATIPGEKGLDIILRNLDREVPRKETSEFAIPSLSSGHAHPEYVYPLPLYQLPANVPPSTNTTPVATPVEPESKRSRKMGSNSARRTAGSQPNQVISENPLLMKGLSPMHQLLFQVPWTRAGMGYLSPLNELLMNKPREFCVSEKEKLKERISKASPCLQEALDVLLEHKRMNLFQTTEYLKIRTLSAASLKTFKNSITRFPFLQPKGSDDLGVAIEMWERFVQPSGGSPIGTPADGDAQPRELEEVELVGILMQLDALAFQIPAKYRLLMLMLDMYDWRVRSQCVCHHMHRDTRPRPWAGDQRALNHWASTHPPWDVFAGVVIPSGPPSGDPLCLHVVPSPPPSDYVLCSMHMSFYYVIESCRHFIRVMSDMCELCFGVTTTDQEEAFWISCDACDKWFHGPCAGLTQAASTFTCPSCVLANPNMSPDRKRMAQSLLQSLPPRRHSPVEPEARLGDAKTLLAEAKCQQIITQVNPAEVIIFKRLVPVMDQHRPE